MDIREGKTLSICACKQIWPGDQLLLGYSPGYFSKSPDPHDADTEVCSREEPAVTFPDSERVRKDKEELDRRILREFNDEKDRNPEVGFFLPELDWSPIYLHIIS